jgi:hypothetical protein
MTVASAIKRGRKGNYGQWGQDGRTEYVTIISSTRETLDHNKTSKTVSYRVIATVM